MDTLFSESKKRTLLSSGLGMVMRNKRYIIWFWLLNLTLAEFGTAAFRRNAHAILDHSAYSEGLVHGFHLAVLVELLARPEFPSVPSMILPAVYFSILFFIATALFLPGVFAGYASTYRLPREDFFRACGRNLLRFIRLMIIAAIVMVMFSVILFGVNAGIVKKAGESTTEVLPFELQMISLFVIFLVMTTLRIWFDLAEADIVLNDQRAVRKSIAAAFRHTFRSFFRLLSSYVVAAIVAAVVLAGGLWCWLRLVPAEGIVRAFLLSQLILIVLLIPRFWQRGVAVSYWRQRMVVPVAAFPVAIPAPPVLPTPEPSSDIPAPASPDAES